MRIALQSFPEHPEEVHAAGLFSGIGRFTRRRFSAASRLDAHISMIM